MALACLDDGKSCSKKPKDSDIKIILSSSSANKASDYDQSVASLKGELIELLFLNEVEIAGRTQMTNKGMKNSRVNDFQNICRLDFSFQELYSLFIFWYYCFSES